MKAELGCKLSQLELSTNVKTFKRLGHSSNDSMEYLKFIDSIMFGDQSKLVLDVFCANAYPELAPTLVVHQDPYNDDYLEEADRAKALLYQLKGDGRNYHARRTHRQGDIAGNQRNKDDDSKKKKPGEQDKPRGNYRNDGSSTYGEGNSATGRKITCFACQEEGHKMPQCSYIQKARELAKAGAANTGEGHTNNDNDGSFDEANIWVAASSEHDDASAHWLIGSGATHNMCFDRSLLFGVEPIHLRICVADGRQVVANVKGKCLFSTMVNGESKSISLTDVNFAPDLRKNLISVDALQHKGVTVTFNGDLTPLHPHCRSGMSGLDT
ncbi:TPA: hypothetical protein N0F65_007020 [Lagenidium giganteum]|uniref:Retrovirus-related Pol polyprotein from transposon TNT 1-94-like beta-barrel domain-containing protein n=1 Tax=Lagenidium giganteum TaxID=4803 RepID=A0AAV2YW49_9STRA|nr:TPA: hypothetical protein N0F65_007020 [Lagenidium giganteum]